MLTLIRGGLPLTATVCPGITSQLQGRNGKSRERAVEQLCYDLYLLYVKLFCISDLHMIFSFLPSSPKEASVEVFSLRAAANENPAPVVRAEVGLCGTRLCLLLSQVRCCVCLKENQFWRVCHCFYSRDSLSISLSFSLLLLSSFQSLLATHNAFLFLCYTSIELCDLTILIYSFRICYTPWCSRFASPGSLSL